MALSEEDRERVALTVQRMIEECRAKPTQEKEDALGLEIASLPAEEREYVSTVLLRIVAGEKDRRDRARRPLGANRTADASPTPGAVSE